MAWNAGCLFVVAAVGVVAGCAGSREAEDAPERLIHEAVLRFADRQFLAGEDLPRCAGIASRAGGPVLDPEAATLAVLAARPPAIRPASGCRESATGVVLGATAAPAALLVSGPITFHGPDEADVQGRVRRGGRPAVSFTYRLVREPGRWRCLGPVVTGVPL